MTGQVREGDRQVRHFAGSLNGAVEWAACVIGRRRRPKVCCVEWRICSPPGTRYSQANKGFDLSEPAPAPHLGFTACPASAHTAACHVCTLDSLSPAAASPGSLHRLAAAVSVLRRNVSLPRLLSLDGRIPIGAAR